MQNVLRVVQIKGFVRTLERTDFPLLGEFDWISCFEKKYSWNCCHTVYPKLILDLDFRLRPRSVGQPKALSTYWIVKSTRPQHPTAFSKKSIDLIREGINRRYSLLPYLYTVLLRPGMYVRPMGFEDQEFFTNFLALWGYEFFTNSVILPIQINDYFEITAAITFECSH